MRMIGTLLSFQYTALHFGGIARICHWVRTHKVILIDHTFKTSHFILDECFELRFRLNGIHRIKYYANENNRLKNDLRD